MTPPAQPGLPLRHLDETLARMTAMMRGGDNVSGLLILLAVIAGAFALLLPDSFLRIGTLQAFMFQMPELGLLSLAMVIPLISGGLNLAVIATANGCALLMAGILTGLMPHAAAGFPLAAWICAALAAGLVAALLIGAVTGLIVALFGVHPILATLGIQTLVGGLSVWLTHGRTLSGFPSAILAVSNATLGGVPYSFLLFLAVAAAVHVLLSQSPLGICIHMIGSNLKATRFSGVDTRRVQVWVYVLSSLLCWLAAIVMMGRFNSASANIAQSYLLVTVLAAILGGVDPYGGFGRVVGLVLSLAILQTISSGFNLLGLSQNLTLAFWGITLLAVMAVKRVWLSRPSRPPRAPTTAAGPSAHDLPLGASER